MSEHSVITRPFLELWGERCRARPDAPAISLGGTTLSYATVDALANPEHLCQRAVQQGLSVSIYRPGFIMPNSVTQQTNVDDFFNRFVRACLQIGAFPRLPQFRWYPVPVDFCARAIRCLGEDQHSPTAGRTLSSRASATFNLVPREESPLFSDEIFARFLPQLHELGWEEWVVHLHRHGSAGSLYPLLTWLSEKVIDARFACLQAHTYSYRIDCEETRQRLVAHELEVPTDGMARWQTYFQQVASAAVASSSPRG